ncbi:MAG: hypothetical protein ABI579_02380 [Candidatus Sumerlaeota bacterium]
MFLKKLLVFLFLLTASITFAVSEKEPYSLRLGVFPDKAEGYRVKKQVEDAGFRPITTYENRDDSLTVLLGPFYRTADAYVVKKLLGTKVDRESVITYMPVTNKDVTYPSFFHLDPASSAAMPIQSLHGNPVYERLEALDTNKNDKTAYAEALRAESPALRNDDPVKGYVNLNLGIVDIIDKNYDDALVLLLPVANGEIASAASNRVMAMIRVAWIMHQKKDRLAAYRAYREIQEWSATKTVRSRCEVECIGLIMELAESEKGWHEEVRKEADTALANLPEDDVAHRATIELMYFESYARQPDHDFQTAAQLGIEFVEKYGAMGEKTPQREYAGALFETGVYLMRLGDKENARKYFNRVLDEIPPDVETFQGVDYHAQSLHGLSLLAFDEGDSTTANQIKRDIIELFPDDPLSKELKRVDSKVMNIEPSVSNALNGETYP